MTSPGPFTPHKSASVPRSCDRIEAGKMRDTEAFSRTNPAHRTKTVDFWGVRNLQVTQCCRAACRLADTNDSPFDRSRDLIRQVSHFEFLAQLVFASSLGPACLVVARANSFGRLGGPCSRRQTGGPYPLQEPRAASDDLATRPLAHLGRNI